MNKSATPGNPTRKELAPGLILEKTKEELKGKTFYLIKIEVQHFNSIDFIVDFTGSNNILINNDPKIKQVRQKLKPFTKTTVARVLLQKGWNLKTSFKYFINLPDIETQKNKLAENIEKQLKKEINETTNLMEIDVREIAEEELFTFLKEKGINYVDHDFLPLHSSINEQENYSIDNYNCVVHWRRSKYLLMDVKGAKANQSLPFIYNNGVSPSDINKGKLVNQKFLSVLSAISENPQLIERLITTTESNEFGFFRVKLIQMAKWKITTLDDYFPCFPFAGPLFIQDTTQELWPMLLEKAFAKKYGNYTNTITQNCKHCFIDLSGCPTFDYKISDYNVKLSLEEETIWHKLSEWIDSGFSVVLYTDEKNSIGEASSSKNHSTLLNIDFDEERVILRDVLKNIDFEFEDNLKGKLKEGVESDKGKLSMGFKDFTDNFNRACVCKIRKWHEISVKGKMIREIDNDNNMRFSFTSRWYYNIKLDKKATIIIGLHQKDKLYPGFNYITPYIDLKINILKLEDGVLKIKECSNQIIERENFFELKLEAGEYYILPFSSGLSLETDDNQDFDKLGTDDIIMKAVINDLFERLDIIDKGYLDEKDISTFYNYLGKAMGDNEFKTLIDKYIPTRFVSLPRDRISEKTFSRIFEDNWKNFTKEESIVFLKKIGFSRSYRSIRTRLFRMTIHCSRDVELDVKEFPKKMAEKLLFIDLLRTKGIFYKGGKKINFEDDDVSLVYYFDEWVNKRA